MEMEFEGRKEGMWLRQIALVAHELEPVVDRLEKQVRVDRALKRNELKMTPRPLPPSKTTTTPAKEHGFK